MTRVEYTENAVRQLEDLDSQTAERILDKIDEAAEWTEHRLEPLASYPYHSLRIGDYRAIIDWDRQDDCLVVEAVGHRRNVYDRHLPP
ncbi:MAG: type II toxin-antitoxin system RelE family toxin [Halodesulfurarchaeum sp.]